MNRHLSVQNSPKCPLCQRLSSAPILPAAPQVSRRFSSPNLRDEDVGWGGTGTALLPWGPASHSVSTGSAGHLAWARTGGVWGGCAVFSKDAVSPRYQLDTEMKTVSAWTINKEFPAVSRRPDSLCSCDAVATPSCLWVFITIALKGSVPCRWGASCNRERYQTPHWCQCCWSVEPRSCKSSLLVKKWVSRQGMEGKMTFPVS